MLWLVLNAGPMVFPGVAGFIMAHREFVGVLMVSWSLLTEKNIGREGRSRLSRRSSGVAPFKAVMSSTKLLLRSRSSKMGYYHNDGG